jgi:tetratricopeptide (TPR) repeat protein/CHAT domain-containing protein
VALLIGLCIVASCPGRTASAQAGPAKAPETDRAGRLQERDHLRAEALRLANAGRLAEAIAGIKSVVAIERDVLGEWSDEVVVSLGLLARLHEATGNWGAARTTLEEVLTLRGRQPGHKEWQVGDTRRALLDLEKRSAMRPEQRGRLQRAFSLVNRSKSLREAGQYPAARTNLLEALPIIGELLGESHPTYAVSLNELAMLYQDQGNYARAEPLYKEALEIRRKALPGGHPDIATSLSNLAVLYYHQGDYARAEPLYKEALEIRRKALPGGHPDIAASLNNLGLLYQSQGDNARAEPLLKEALEIRSKALPGGHPDIATSLNNLATLYQAQGDNARAEPLLKQALEISRKALPEGHPNVAAALNNLAELYRTRGDYANAEPLLKQALEISRKALPEGDLRIAPSLSCLGLLYQSQGDSARAELLLKQALEINRKALPEGHPHIAAVLGYLAHVYRDRGDYARAEPFVRQALEIRRKALPGGHPDIANSLINLGDLYRDQGDYARAEPLLRQALEIRRKALPGGHPDIALSLNNLAGLYLLRGDYARAEPLLKEALEVWRKARPEGHPDIATGLHSLAALYRAMGDSARAELLFKQALEIWRKARPEGDPRIATCLSSLGSLYRALGDFARAEPLLRQALEIQRKALPEGHPDIANSLDNLAALYQVQGDCARAEPLFKQALEIYRKALPEGHPDIATILSNLAFLCQAQGDSIQAEALSRRSLEILSQAYEQNSIAIGERPRLELLKSVVGALGLRLTLAQEVGERPEALYRLVLDWKGAAARAGDDRLVRDRPELRAALDELRGVRARLAHLALTAPPAARRDAWRTEFDALRERKEDLEADLARRSADYRDATRVARVGPADLAAALPDDTALVDLIVYTHYSPAAGGKGEPVEEPRVLAFVVSHDRPVACVALGEAHSIDDAVRAWLTSRAAGRGGAMDRAADEIARRVWEPLRTYLSGLKTVLVAPDGMLMYFPLAALPGHRPGTYLIEDLAIGYVASGRDAAATFAAPAGPPAGGLLAAGDIDFQADPGRAATGLAGRPALALVPEGQRAGFDRLPGTRAEAVLARDLFRRAFADQPAVLLTGAEPTEAAVKARLDGGHWRAVHLGTHGFSEPPQRVAALLAGVRPGLPSAAAVPRETGPDEALALSLAPFLSSGLVLAGGGRAPDPAAADPLSEAPAAEDGILTAEEVLSLDLRGTDLVVLSACRTGLGEGRYGQGVLGLPRAFHAAGARAVAATLWPVDDAATSVLMERFYTNLWEKKLPRLEALRQAQLAVLRGPGLVSRRRQELERGIEPNPAKLPGGGVPVPAVPSGARSDPSYWAAFVLTGDVR